MLPCYLYIGQYMTVCYFYIFSQFLDVSLSFLTNCDYFVIAMSSYIARGIWDYRTNAYIEDTSAFLLFWLALGLLTSPLHIVFKFS